ncbi:hypothetical protein [Pectobacterium parmentieri]|uniref:hypothetical protein n=1 Tax=Pectobacterium parmentieri TaxID=1905730 RepID=UPI0018E1D85A|nr:hypothetical protein [Pectobacterium parmentieri]QQA74551.1 hypothetical protein JBL47_14195 [Pectobacterium parmentieri]
MNIKKTFQYGTLLLSLISLSGCVIVENIKLRLEGFDVYRSSASALVYKMDNTVQYTSPLSYNVTIDRKDRYVRYLIDTGSFLVGFPMVTAEDYDKTIQKLTMFESWANEPYEQRVKTITQVQNSLPDNDPEIKTEKTDFYLFMSSSVKNNEPYLAYDRDIGYTTKVRILMDKENVEIIINELKKWRANSLLKNK